MSKTNRKKERTDLYRTHSSRGRARVRIRGYRSVGSPRRRRLRRRGRGAAASSPWLLLAIGQRGLDPDRIRFARGWPHSTVHKIGTILRTQARCDILGRAHILRHVEKQCRVVCVGPCILARRHCTWSLLRSPMIECATIYAFWAALFKS
jgi:hypothetical protein